MDSFANAFNNKPVFIVLQMMRFLRWITPFVVLLVLITIYLLYFLLTRKTAEEVQGMILVPFAITALIIIAVDIILRKSFKQKIHYIWITEVVLFIAAIYLFTIN